MHKILVLLFFACLMQSAMAQSNDGFLETFFHPTNQVQVYPLDEKRR